MVGGGIVDSGPLLETCTAAGATLVAIVGGLLVARYVTLEAELQAAADRVTETEARLSAAEDSRTAAIAELQSFDVEWELDDSEIQTKILAAVRRDDPVTVEQLRALADFDNTPDETIESVLEKWNAEARRVVDADRFWDAIPDGPKHQTWPEFKRGRNIITEVDELWQTYYDAKVAQKKRKASLGSFVPIAAFRPPTAWQPNARKRLVQIRDETVGKAEALKAELRLADENRARISRPPGLRLGLVVLGFLTVASVVVPVLYLAPSPAELSYREATFIVASFFLGILVLFGYMGYHVYRLHSLGRERDKRRHRI